MIRYRKLRDLKTAMENVVDDDSLVSALFESMPELQIFTFVKNQEYDDNNYYDNIRVTSINGHPYGYDGYEDDNDYSGKEPSSLPKIEHAHLVEDLVGFIAERYDNSEEDVEYKREDFVGLKRGHETKGRREERRYFVAHLAGKKLPDSFFVKSDPKYALYYALDHGRFKPEIEFKILARRGEMYHAVEYARHVIKGRLPQEVENFYFLDAAEEDRENLKNYVAEFCSGERRTA